MLSAEMESEQMTQFEKRSHLGLEKEKKNSNRDYPVSPFYWWPTLSTARHSGDVDWSRVRTGQGGWISR